MFRVGGACFFLGGAPRGALVVGGWLLVWCFAIGVWRLSCVVCCCSCVMCSLFVCCVVFKVCYLMCVLCWRLFIVVCCVGFVACFFWFDA